MEEFHSLLSLVSSSFDLFPHPSTIFLILHPRLSPDDEVQTGRKKNFFEDGLILEMDDRRVARARTSTPLLTPTAINGTTETLHLLHVANVAVGLLDNIRIS